MAKHEFDFPTNETPERTPRRRELLINSTVVLAVGLILVFVGLGLALIPLGVIGVLLVIGAGVVLALALLSGGRSASDAPTQT